MPVQTYQTSWSPSRHTLKSIIGLNQFAQSGTPPHFYSTHQNKINYQDFIKNKNPNLQAILYHNIGEAQYQLKKFDEAQENIKKYKENIWKYKQIDEKKTEKIAKMHDKKIVCRAQLPLDEEQKLMAATDISDHGKTVRVIAWQKADQILGRWRLKLKETWQECEKQGMTEMDV